MMNTFPTLPASGRALLVLVLAAACFAGAMAFAQPAVNGDPDAVALEPAQAAELSARTVAAEVKATVGQDWDRVKESGYAHRTAVASSMVTAEAALDANILEWTARKDAASAEARPVVSAALEEVRNAREVLRQKVDALDNATVETWTSVITELDSAWQRVRSSSALLAAKLERNS